MTQITVAALQLAFSNDIDANIANVSRLVREAAGRGDGTAGGARRGGSGGEGTRAGSVSRRRVAAWGRLVGF